MMRRVMIVDDERMIGEALKHRLDASGYDALLFTNGCSALATIELESSRSPLGLVLLDVNMPGMDGIAVLREIRQRHREIPVIMMSATTDREVFAKALRAGACDYLEKPIDMVLLAQKCRKAFEERSLP